MSNELAMLRNSSVYDLELSHLLDQGNVTTTPEPLFPPFSVDFALLLLSLLLAIVWITYLTFFHSRVLGWVLTKVVNRFFLDRHSTGYLTIGSFSVSVLAGKVMFRELILTREDVIYRVQDGWVVFKYWLCYAERPANSDFSHGKQRLVVCLNGLEVHVFSQTARYKDIDSLFGLKKFGHNFDGASSVSSRSKVARGKSFNGESTRSDARPGRAGISIYERSPAGTQRNIHPGDISLSATQSQSVPAGVAPAETPVPWSKWQDLFPVVKVDVSTGRLMFGNKHLPSTFVCSYDNADLIYTTRHASNPFDLFRHSLRGRAENVKLSFVKSARYLGPYETPPRIMGEGFAALQAASLDFHFSMDEPARVKGEAQVLTSSGDNPYLGLELQLGKGTVISYGPWADRQRDRIYNFFFPQEFQIQPETLPPGRGEKRIHVSFELKVVTLYPATLDLLFSKNDVTDALHIAISKGSCCEFSLPYVVRPDGYSAVLQGTLMQLQSSTSLPYRNLIDCETLEFTCDFRFPRKWNEVPTVWSVAVSPSKSTFYFVYRHKAFLTDLLEDWSGTDVPDIFKFYPFRVDFSLVFCDFEVILLTNEFNWVDTSSCASDAENLALALCGKHLKASFLLPWLDFQPAATQYDFQIDAEGLVLKLFYPESSVQRAPFLALMANASLPASEDSSVSGQRAYFSRGKAWSHGTLAETGWAEVAHAPLGGAVHVKYTLHSNPAPYKSRYQGFEPVAPQMESFDPASLTPDLIDLVVELAPTSLLLVGGFLQHFLAFKDNYIGEYQEFSEMSNLSGSDSSGLGGDAEEGKQKYGHVTSSSFVPGNHRPLHVIVALKIHHLHGYALTMRTASKSDVSASCPRISVEELVFEMDKRYTGTLLQLCLSPAKLEFAPVLGSAPGNLLLRGLQFRGNAMFSNQGLPLDAPTLEYGWLMEIIMGDILGSISFHHMQQLVEWLVTAQFQLEPPRGDRLQMPSILKMCAHMQHPNACDKNPYEILSPGQVRDFCAPCPAESDLKYKMTRVIIDEVCVQIADADIAVEVWLEPLLRVCLCTMHSRDSKAGVSVVLPPTSVRQFQLLGHDKESNRATWLECAAVHAGPLNVDVALPSQQARRDLLTERRNFLYRHDKASKRLEFLWKTSGDIVCSCRGGSRFFGRNRIGKDVFSLPGDSEMPKKQAVITLEEEPGEFGFCQSVLPTLEEPRCALSIGNLADMHVVRTSHRSSAAPILETARDNRSRTSDSDVFYDAESPANDEDAVSLAESFETASIASQKEGGSATAEDVWKALHKQLSKPINQCGPLMRVYARHLQVELRQAYALTGWSGHSSLPSWFRFEPARPDEPCFRAFTLKDKLGPVGGRTPEPLLPKKESSTSSGRPGRVSPSSHSSSEGLGLQVTTNRPVQVFFTPPALDVIHAALRILAEDKENPLVLLSKILMKCTASKHAVQLIGHLREDQEEQNAADTPLHLGINLPRLDLLLFEAGLFERVVPGVPLQAIANSLISPSGIVCAVSGITCCTTSFKPPAASDGQSPMHKDDERPPVPFTIIGSSGIEAVHFQMIQIVDQERANPCIGLSPNVSKLPLELNLASMGEKYKLTKVVCEGGVEMAAAKFDYTNRCAQTQESVMAQHGAPAGPVPSCIPSVPLLPPVGGEESPSTLVDTLAVTVDSCFVNCALGVPADEAGERWPMYEIYAPGLNAWLHVCFRLSDAASLLGRKWKEWRRLALGYLLAAAWPRQKEFSCSGEKKRSRHFSDCPTCFLAWSVNKLASGTPDFVKNVLKECEDPALDAFLVNRALPDILGGFQSRLVKSGCISCSKIPPELHTWILREIDGAFRATSTISRVESEPGSEIKGQGPVQVARSPSSQSMPAETTVVDETAPLRPSSPPGTSGKKPNSDGDIQPNVNVKEMRRQLSDMTHRRQSLLDAAIARPAVSSVGTHASQPGDSVGGRRHPGGEPTAASRQPDDDDMYHWMQRETHVALTKKKEGIRSAAASQKQSRAHGTSDERPRLDLDVLPTELFFEPIYTALEMDVRKPFVISFIEEKLQRLSLRFSLSSLNGTLIEPKVLRHLGTTRRSVSHTERRCISVRGVAVNADVDHKFSESLPDGSGCGSMFDINYHTHLDKVEVDFGFTIAALVNQLSFVARSASETCAELVDSKKTLVLEVTPAASFHDEVEDNVSEAAMMDQLFDLGGSVECLIPEKEGRAVRFRNRFRQMPKVSSGVKVLKDDALFSPVAESQKGVGAVQLAADVIRCFALDRRARAQLQSPHRLVSISKDNYRLVVGFGVIDVPEIWLTAAVTELAFCTTVNNVQVGHSIKNSHRLPSNTCVYSELSITSDVHKATISLQDTTLPATQAVAIMAIGKSQFLYTQMLKQSLLVGGPKGSVFLEVGPVAVSIPLNPGVLHGVVVRNTQRIADTLKDLKTPGIIEEIHVHRPLDELLGEYTRTFGASQKSGIPVTFCIICRSLNVSAALLPSLKALYKMGEATVSGTTEGMSKFYARLPDHKLTFDVAGLVTPQPDPCGPSEPISTIDLELPELTAEGAMLLDDVAEDLADPEEHHKVPRSAKIPKVTPLPLKVTENRAKMQPGSYLNVSVNIGKFQHTLTTDLLNQMLFIEEAFMRELGEIVQKITSAKKRQTFIMTPTAKEKILFVINVSVDKVQMTSTTPTSTAIRFETYNAMFQLSNRVSDGTFDGDGIYGMADISLCLSLGQLVRYALFEEVAPDFQEYAYFKTRVKMRNTPSSVSTEFQGSTAFLISLVSPSIHILPVAVDKAILLWINYKNAYDSWAEQRQQVRKKTAYRKDSRNDFNLPNVLEQISSPNVPSALVKPLFLQVKVENGIQICMPLCAPHYTGFKNIDEGTSALVVLLNDTGISVCTYGALVSSGTFKGFCVAILDNFDPAAENWNADLDSRKLTEVNCCIVPEGTYKICSRTSTPSAEQPCAEWLLNVDWYMKGVEMNFNTHVGKAFSQLIATLTSLTVDEDERGVTSSAHVVHLGEKQVPTPTLPGSERPSPASAPAAFLQSPPDISAVDHSDAVELRRAMQQQIQYVHELQMAGANEMVLENERRKIQQLEAHLSRHFRSDMRQRLKKQSQRATNLKDRLGLASSRTRAHKTSTQGHRSTGTQHQPKTPILRRNTDLSEELQRRANKMHPRTASFDASLPSPITEEEACSTDSTDSDDLTASKSPTPSEMPFALPSNSSGSGVSRTPPAFFTETSEREAGTPTAKAGGAENLPPVNFYLDFKVHVEKGSCKLYTNETKPVVAESRKSGKGQAAGWRLKQNPTLGPLPTFTLIEIPGLNVKSMYISRDDPLNLKRETLNVFGAFSDSIVEDILSSSKKAQFCMWLSLESMPAETEVSTHILDFVEQAMEPFAAKPPVRSISSPPSTTGTVEEAAHEPGLTESMTQWGDVALMQPPASFPVDVLVYCNVQSSALRFSCKPYSLVQCLVKLPALSVVATSRKGSKSFHPDSASSPRASIGVRSRKDDDFLTGGINVSVTLSDFSLYIFHAYNAALSARQPSISDAERRDSLSWQLQSAVINISRRRNLFSLGSSGLGSTPRLGGLSKPAENSVQFSLVVDLGIATFHYDMRRLNEILEFPKSWYRRSIMRRFFLGDDSVLFHHDEAAQSGLEQELPSSGGSACSDSVADVYMPSSSFAKKPAPEPQAAAAVGHAKSTEREQSKWTALVLYVINFSEMNIHANMGNTMGKTSWVTKNASSQGHLAVDSSGNRKLHASLAFRSSILDSKSGMVSGNVSLQDLSLFTWLLEAPGWEPKHCVGATLGSSEAKVEWMGTSIFMGYMSQLSLEMKDKWQLLVHESSSPIAERSPRPMPKPPVAVREASVDFMGSIQWKQLQIMICRATVTDLVKIANRLYDFFHAEFNSGRNIFASRPYGRRDPDELEDATQEGEEKESPKYHRYWQRPLDLISHFLVSMRFPIPAKGLSLGGTLDLAGDEIALACFHGPNFRANRWALFHLRYPLIGFCSRARDDVIDEKLSTKIQQDLSFILGDRSKIGYEHTDKPMATVLQVLRSSYVPPQVGSIHEWFQYTFTSVLSTVYGSDYTFKTPSSTVGAKGTFTTPAAGTPQSASFHTADYRHSVTHLFRLPVMRLNLHTLQVQGQDEPELGDVPPTVECSFTTDFEDFLHVRVDAEAYYFLADLVRSYMQAAEAKPSQSGGAVDLSSSDPEADLRRAKQRLLSPSSARRMAEHPTEELQKDGRAFVCTNWCLEPRVRFIDMTSLEPYGVDYVLQRLGFQHARITIPKWTQRGFMDPLDAMMAKMLEAIVILSKKPGGA